MKGAPSQKIYKENNKRSRILQTLDCNIFQKLDTFNLELKSWYSTEHDSNSAVYPARICVSMDPLQVVQNPPKPVKKCWIKNERLLRISNLSLFHQVNA